MPQPIVEMPFGLRTSERQALRNRCLKGLRDGMQDETKRGKRPKSAGSDNVSPPEQSRKRGKTRQGSFSTISPCRSPKTGFHGVHNPAFANRSCYNFVVRNGGSAHGTHHHPSPRSIPWLKRGANTLRVDQLRSKATALGAERRPRSGNRMRPQWSRHPDGRSRYRWWHHDYHAMTPPARKLMAELGLQRRRRR